MEVCDIVQEAVIKTIPQKKKRKKAKWISEEVSSIPGLGRSPEEGKGYPLQCSGLENSMDCVVHEVTKNWAAEHNMY